MTVWEYKALDGSPVGTVEAADLRSATEAAHAICGSLGCEYVRAVTTEETN